MVIHTIGDSHASNQHSGWKDCSNICSHWLGPVLCHSFARDTFNGSTNVNLFSFGVRPGDAVVFCFGEIDCRCHVHKHITAEKSYQSIIDELVTNYFKAIQQHCQHHQNVTVCIYSVPPTIEKLVTDENSAFPFLGTDAERQAYVKYFNEKIAEKCQEYQYIFFDVFQQYVDEKGFLNRAYSDASVHIQNGCFLQEFINKNLR